MIKTWGNGRPPAVMGELESKVAEAVPELAHAMSLPAPSIEELRASAPLSEEEWECIILSRKAAAQALSTTNAIIEALDKLIERRKR